MPLQIQQSQPKISEETLVILIAPNVSEQMGGEAIKPLQIFQELKKQHPRTLQITHERNQSEITGRLKLKDVYYIKDSWISMFLWRSVVLRLLMNWWFSTKAVQLARMLAAERGADGRSVIVWQTEPNSPVTPRIISPGHFNCFGPINGNIYYPSTFRSHEKLLPKFRRVFHMPVQRLNRWLFRDITKADLIFCAGGDRTRRSLIARGCPENIQIPSLDCGIRDALLEFPRVAHAGRNLRFIQFGRLVFHKGTFLIIQSLAKTSLPIQLDIVGRGPELERCQQLVRELGLADRVRFLGWYSDHSELFKSLSQYRGFVLPSLEDANGIAVQEAMAVGLPAICLNWGGPQLLIDHGSTGFLVEPTSVEHIIMQLAEYMEALATNGELAEQVSIRSREQAKSWRWSQVLQDWNREITKLLPSKIHNP